MTRIYLGGLM